MHQRPTAAHAIASRRDVVVLEALIAATATAKEKDVKTWMEAAATVVGGGSMDVFQDFVEKVVTPSK